MRCFLCIGNEYYFWNKGEGCVYTRYEPFWQVHEWYVIHRWLLCLADLVYKYHMIYNLILLYDICYFIQKSLKMKMHGLQYCIYYIHTSRNFRGDFIFSVISFGAESFSIAKMHSLSQVMNLMSFLAKNST